MSERNDLASEIDALLQRGAPERLIAVGETAQALLAPYAEASGAPLVTAAVALPLPQIDGLPYDLALLAGNLDAAPSEELSVLVGRLRDLYARRIWVVLPAGREGFGHRDLIGHGFSRAGSYRLGEREVRLYEFDIGTYKTTPDWLNSKNWANPRLFDKYRW